MLTHAVIGYAQILYLVFFLTQMVKKGNILAFLGHPMGPSVIVACHNGQAKKDRETFASYDTSKKLQ